MENKPTLIKQFSHTDLDGVGSALLLQAILQEQKGYVAENYLPVGYSEPGADGTIDKHVLNFIQTNEDPVTELYITDICPSDDVIAQLAAYCAENKISWHIFDHHITSIHVNENYPKNASIIVADEATNLKHSATSVLFKVLVGKMPTELFQDEVWQRLANVADIIRCYDCWDWQLNPNAAYKESAAEFNNLFYFYSWDKRIELMGSVMSAGLNLLFDYSEIISALKEKEADYVRSKSLKAQFGVLDGKTFAYTFGEQYTSVLGNALARLEHPETKKEVDFSLVLNGKGVSLRTNNDDIDLSVLAARYFNGGGHKRASGGAFAEIQYFISDSENPAAPLNLFLDIRR